MNTRLTGTTNRQCAGRAPPDVTEQADDALRGHLQPLADVGKVRFREQIGKPGQQPIGRDWASTERHRE